MAEHAEFENSLDRSFILNSNTNTSNTNANQSITSPSGSIVSLEFDEEEESFNGEKPLNSEKVLISNTSLDSNKRASNHFIGSLFVNEDKSHIGRPSTVDETFQCNTKLCACSEDSVTLSVSKYTTDSCVLSSLSASTNLHELGSHFGPKSDGDIKYANIYQDCECIKKQENKGKHTSFRTTGYKFTTELSTASEFVNITHRISDDFGSIPVISLASVNINPDHTNMELDSTSSIISITDTAKFEQNQKVYFTPDEVVIHNQPDDLWVSYLGNVYNLTPLIEKHKGTREIKPLLAFAGKDISDWFDTNGELRHYIHPMTGVRVPYLPHGPIPDIRPHVPTTTWRPMCACAINEDEEEKSFVPWWRSRRYFIGKLTKCARPIRIVNMLTLDECTLNVCTEDKLSRILERLLRFNSHAQSYTFKYDTRVLDMDKTLDENRIFDERETYIVNYLPEDTYIPAIHLYFNDDFQWDLDTSDENDD